MHQALFSRKAGITFGIGLMFSSPGPSVSDLSLYGGQDPRELPRYTYNEASRATGVPASTIAAWVRGMPYASHTGQKAFFEPVIRRPTRVAGMVAPASNSSAHKSLLTLSVK